MLSLIGLLAQLQLLAQLPAPVGYVNDFAHVVDPASRQRMLALIEEVRAKSGGEIVVVTLPDLGGRASIEVARDLGRQWRVGAKGGPGERARNAGVVLLLKPGMKPGDGRAELAIATGTGTEGFITDAQAGRIRDAIGRAAVEQGSYAAGLVVGVELLARAYAREFGFELSGAPTAGPEVEPAPVPGAVALLVVALVFLVFLVPVWASALSATRYRRPYYRAGSGWLDALILTSMLGGRRGGGRWGGWGGGFGGGFGGFGGGGGFSGGGASGRF